MQNTIVAPSRQSLTELFTHVAPDTTLAHVTGNHEAKRWNMTRPAPSLLFGSGFMFEIKFDRQKSLMPGCGGNYTGIAVGRLHLGTVKIPVEVTRQARKLMFNSCTGQFHDQETGDWIETASGLILKDELHSLYIP